MTSLRQNKLRGLRNRLLDSLLEIRFRLHTTRVLFDKPKFDYQPLPWVGIELAPVRGDATERRWTLINESLPVGTLTAKDIGCSVGYFCHQLAIHRGVFSIGLDQNPRHIDIANFVRTRANLGTLELFGELRLTPENVEILPPTDVTLLLSIWHHWVEAFGLDVATEMLVQVWKSTAKALYFESGEDEVAKEFGLPFTSDAREWLANYLMDSLPGSSVSILGTSEAGHYAHYPEGMSRDRALFAVVRA